MLAMMYVSAEFVQLIVSQSYSELEVQRYNMKINTFTVRNEWVNVKNRPQTAKVSFLMFELWTMSFQFLNFEVSLVLFGF